jgi:hypothetical protein
MILNAYISYEILKFICQKTYLYFKTDLKSFSGYGLDSNVRRLLYYKFAYNIFCSIFFQYLLQFQNKVAARTVLKQV